MKLVVKAIGGRYTVTSESGRKLGRVEGYSLRPNSRRSIWRFIPDYRCAVPGVGALEAEGYQALMRDLHKAVWECEQSGQPVFRT